MRLSQAIGVPASLISGWSSGTRPIPAERCPVIEAATRGAVTRRDLRPDDWHLIWPELIGTEGAPEAPVGSMDQAQTVNEAVAAGEGAA